MHLGIGLANKLKSPVLTVSCGVVRKNDCLGELWHWGFLAFLVAMKVCYMFVTVAFGKNYVLESCGWAYSEMWLGKLRVIITAWKVSKWEVFSGPYFPVFGNIRIQSEYMKIQTRKKSVFGHFSRGELRQIKPICWWYIDLVVKHLHCVNCLNTWATNCTTFWNQKLLYRTVFLHKNEETKEFFRSVV